MPEDSQTCSQGRPSYVYCCLSFLGVIYEVSDPDMKMGWTQAPKALKVGDGRFPDIERRPWRASGTLSDSRTRYNSRCLVRVDRPGLSEADGCFTGCGCKINSCTRHALANVEAINVFLRDGTKLVTDNAGLILHQIKNDLIRWTLTISRLLTRATSYVGKNYTRALQR